MIELRNVKIMGEVDESITHVASVLEVNREVEEVITILHLLINSVEKHLLGVFVGNIFDHHCISLVFTSHNHGNI